MPPTTPAKVLVIDDELGPRESLRILLKNEFQVFIADSVPNGLRMLQDQQPDVVIMDIRMPGMNGLDGLTEIRKLDQDVSVLMLTGFAALESAQEAIRRGANDYLKKPFDTREMLETVRRYVPHTRFRRRYRQTAEEVRKINQTLIEELARKDHLAQIGQKSQEFVHDLRNPLTAVLGYVELLGDELRQSKDKFGSQWEETAEFLQNIEKNLDRCREMSAMWLQLGRKDRQKLRVLSLSDVLREVAEAMRPRCLERNVKLEVEITGEKSDRIEAEHIQIVRAFDNLLGNALDAVSDGTGIVKIRCECGDKEAEIRFTDNGNGIRPENLQRIFEPYFTTKGKAGTGLGLFITQQVIVERGGTITAESLPGKGATFIVRLPLTSKS